MRGRVNGDDDPATRDISSYRFFVRFASLKFAGHLKYR